VLSLPLLYFYQIEFRQWKYSHRNHIKSTVYNSWTKTILCTQEHKTMLQN